MNWDAFGAIGEIIGAIGVVITLVYLAYQISQNTHQPAANGFGRIFRTTTRPIFNLKLIAY
jgi:hypothetical protein